MKHRRVSGFHLHRSNRLESLAGTLGGVMRESLSSPLVPEAVVVQSQGMARWLKLELAARLGIAAHIRFPFPRAFAHELFRALDLTVDSRPSFDPELLVWRIYQLLPEAAQQPGFASVKRYLADGDQRKRFQLAGRLARLFDQYLVYRPDLIAAWDSGASDWPERFGAEPGEIWQSQLWKMIGEDWAAGHPAAWLHEFLRTAQAGRLPTGRLPERVSIFGVSSLPPFHLELLKALSTVCEVHLFLLQPTEHYWGDVRSRREQALQRRRAGGSPMVAPDDGHRLVSSLGRTGREMLDLLLDRDAQDEQEVFVAVGAGTLLGRLQDAMRSFEQRGSGEPRQKVAAGDESIRIHSCHGAMREVEVLRDHLLKWFNDEPTLQPRDVVVMVPDLETYAPLLEAVFSLPESPDQFIPFSIADRSPRSGGLGAALWQVLELMGGLFGASEVVSLLEREPVRRRFGLDEDDVERCRSWVRDAEIRWGRDAGHAASHNAGDSNSWPAGLSRLLISYAIGGEAEIMSCGVARSVGVDGGDAECLGGFCRFAETLLRFSADAGSAADPGGWARRLDGLCADLFDTTGVAASEAETIRAAVTTLRDASQWAGCREPIGLDVVMEHLGNVLSEDRRGSGFLHGGVTICGLKPMRSIPFKAVCLIGMNQGVFPRQSTPLAFDLAARRRRAGDSSSRDDDRHLFLETILSARQRIHISYVGQSQRDGKDIPPSVVVSELLDHLDHEYESTAGESLSGELLVKHRLQAFSPDYFNSGKLFSFSTANQAAAQALVGRRTPPKPALAGTCGDGEPAQALDLAVVIRFFRNPARHFAENQLSMRFSRTEESLPEEEDFCVGRRENHGLVEAGISALRAGRDIGSVLAVQGAAGRLPTGPLRSPELSRIARETRGFWSRCEPYFVPVARRIAGPVVSDSGAVLTGSVEVFGNTVVVARYSKLESRPDYLLAAWIELLFAASLDSSVQRAVVIGRDETLLFCAPDQPKSVLNGLLEVYGQGQFSVLPFACKTSFAFAGKMLGKVRAESERGRLSIDAAMAVWRPSQQNEDAPPAESNDEAMQLAFANLDLPALPEFAVVSLKVFKPLLLNREEAP